MSLLIYWYAACRYAECRGAVQKEAMGDKRNAKKHLLNFDRTLYLDGFVRKKSQPCYSDFYLYSLECLLPLIWYLKC